MDTLIWVIVPNGHAAGTSAINANIVVMPRLESTSLAAAGMASWPPAELATGKIWLDFTDADGAARPPIAATLSLAAEPGLWERYFPAETPISPGQDGARDARAFVVHALANDAAIAEQIFREVANAPLAQEGQRHAAHVAAVAAALTRNPVGPPPPCPGARRATSSAARGGLPEFHDTLGLLREHPTMQKALGLILPVQIILPAQPLPVTGFIKVRWDGAPAGIPTIVSPRTAYELSDGRFLPQSTDSIVAGMVPIGDAAVGERVADESPHWRVMTVDVVSAAGVMRDAASRLQARADAGAETAMPLPALRTGGISIARIGLQAEIDARHAGLQAHRVATADTTLGADDLLLGYRLDVQRDGDSWRSLNLRRASYKVDSFAIAAGSVLEEGHLKAGAAVDYGDGQLVTDDIVARWTGWSATIQRPSYMVDPTDADLAPGHLTWKFDGVASTLPRLRFGARYRLRMRTADIAGGGLDANDPLAERCATGVIPYGRYEPIASPQLLAPTEGSYLPGESDASIVIRSDVGLTPAQFAAANQQYAAGPVRSLTPPLTTVGMAEQHQMFDLLAADKVWSIVAPVLSGADPKSRLALADPAAGGVAAFVPGMPTSITRAWKEWPSVSPKRILAQALSDPLEPQISWRDDDLAVSLAQAATTSIELSSTLRQGLEGHIAAQIFAAPGAAAAGIAAAREGRSPLVTPSIAVTVTHAVRRPLKDPSGTLAGIRSKGETRATLTPSMTMLGLDPESTGRLEISADWSEPDDATTVQIVGRMVKAMSIDRGAADLPEALRHEFGDTRHRSIYYTAKAISRFRNCFFESEPDEWFTAKPLKAAVEVPNSDTPPIVKILRTFPSFVWTVDAPTAPATIVHKRGALLRVELGRPWFMTGEGEQLAVIVAPDGVPSASLQNQLSEAGRDPIWQTGTPARWLRADQFGLASGPAMQVTPPGAAGNVIAVPHVVSFDQGRGCWFCDIAVAGIGDASYAPLVRLALVRYQAASLDGLSTSRIMRTDFVPLLPSRTLTIDRSAPLAVTAILAGLGPEREAGNRVEYVLETAPAGVPLDAPSAVFGVTDSPSVWRAVDANPVVAKLGAAAHIAIPQKSGQLRLLVSEVDGFVARGDVTSADPLERRVIFTDLVALG